MKKLLVASAIALFGLTSAQIAKGTKFISGQVGYTGEKNNNNDATVSNFAIVPTVGYFVKSNFAVGLGVGYTNETAKEKDLVEYKDVTSAFVLEPFARKYWTLGEKFYFFGQLSVPMAFGNYKGEVDGDEVFDASYTKVGVVVKPGIDYILNKNWTMEATIGQFGYETSKLDGAKSVDNYGFGLNLNTVTFGVKYLF